ncbi:MAG: ComEC family competence protein, partial [Parcubacteria group bacterium]|nr:ComEC family competence protein [Parcubacteria group bacterium]
MQKHFLVLIAGFTGGIAFRSFFDFGAAFAFFLLALGIVLVAYFFLFHCKTDLLKSDFNKSSAVVFTGLFIIAAGAGILRFDYSENPTRMHALDAYLGRMIILEGIIADEPDVRTNHTKLVVETEQIVSGDETISVVTKILVIAERYPEFSYGDAVRLRGIPQKPPRAIEDDANGGRPFDYAAYLAKDGIYYEMYRPHMERLSFGGGPATKFIPRVLEGLGTGNPIQRALFSLKRAYLQKLGEMLPEPHAALAGGITVGAKEALGGELLDTFRTAGIIHVVVLSGYNIAIVARTFARGAFFLPRMAGIGFSAAGIILFALMTGAGATVVRASLMALIVLLAHATGRVAALTVALIAAAFLMLLHNPHILVFDPSFQLSFLATLGILYLAPRTERFFMWLPSALGIREAASATLATQVFVLPALVYMTGKFSIVSFAANLFILPLMPASMLFSFLSGALALVVPIISIPFSYIAWALLEYGLVVARLAASLPFAAISIPPISAWFFAGAYIILVGVFVWRAPFTSAE